MLLQLALFKPRHTMPIAISMFKNFLLEKDSKWYLFILYIDFFYFRLSLLGYFNLKKKFNRKKFKLTVVYIIRKILIEKNSS